VSKPAWIEGEKPMFRETLLESSPMARRNKRWPMATAFVAELIVAGILIMVPLFSTGVLPSFARVADPIFRPEKPVEIKRVRPQPTSGTGPTMDGSHTTVVTLASTNPDQIHLGPPRPTTNDPADPNLVRNDGFRNPLENLINKGGNKDGPVRRGNDSGPVKVSSLSEARLLNRVEPIYPKMAIIAGIRGEVKLHAIIARDGSIQSLNVSSGHPILAAAALDAVRQWRYQPYILNGDPVEVDTLITVNFKRGD